MLGDSVKEYNNWLKMWEIIQQSRELSVIYYF